MFTQCMWSLETMLAGISHYGCHHNCCPEQDACWMIQIHVLTLVLQHVMVVPVLYCCLFHNGMTGTSVWKEKENSMPARDALPGK